MNMEKVGDIPSFQRERERERESGKKGDSKIDRQTDRSIDKHSQATVTTNHDVRGFDKRAMDECDADCGRPAALRAKYS